MPGWQAQDHDAAEIIGSNNWAVDGAHTASGVALVANDMHLSIAVPIIWYRASMAFPDADGAPQKITGLTLPGLPSIVVGSNGHVAWGFTNTGGDWSDLVRIEPDPRDAGQVPDAGRSESLRRLPGNHCRQGRHGQDARGALDHLGTHRLEGRARARVRAALGRPRRQDRSPPTSPRPERALSVDDLLTAFAGLGMPNQNVTMGDDTGRIAWTIGGVIPRRVGLDGLTPESWADGSRRWDGYLSAADFPRIVDPPGGRIWTANAPVVDGACSRPLAKAATPTAFARG